MTAVTCQDVLASLSDYLDGETLLEQRVAIEQHLAACADCFAVADTLRKTVLLYHELPAPALSRAARERLYRALDLVDV
ncbi:MAG: zf-HC2 domain-containing protein [Anaerolineae bacterium]|nr:zf-HC2 domain-containing protein [Anaerolineae bacterium]